MEVVVLNDWVTLTKVKLAPVEHLHQLGEVHERAAQSVDLVDDDEVDGPASMSASRRFRAGRSRVPPEMPPSSYRGPAQHPALRLLADNVGLQASRWASSALNSMSRPSSRFAGVDGAAELA